MRLSSYGCHSCMPRRHAPVDIAGFFRACDQSRVLAGPLASKPDRSGQAGRRLVEADEPTGVARMIVAATQDPGKQEGARSVTSALHGASSKLSLAG